jgi:hypothetical protein
MNEHLKKELDILFTWPSWRYCLLLVRRTIISIPMMLFGIVTSGIYKILIKDSRGGTTVYTGYVWAKGSEFRSHLKKRVRRSIKSHKLEPPKGGYSIKIVDIRQDKVFEDEDKLVMWTEPDFILQGDMAEIEDPKLYSLHKNFIMVMKKIIKKIKKKTEKTKGTKPSKKVPFIDKVVSSVVAKAMTEKNLLETHFLDYEGKCVMKCFTVSGSDKQSCSLIRQELKKENISLKGIKEVLFKTYKKEELSDVIWLKNNTGSPV